MGTETEELRRRIMEVLEYSPETGMLRWKVLYNPAQKKGWFPGNLHGNAGQKHRQVTVFKKKFKVHRLAWLLMTGEYPKGEIDHEDQDKDNNRFKNLRDVTRTQNSRNHRRQKRNKSGMTGVHFDKARRKWTVQIRINYKQINLGRFENIEDAIEVRKRANVQYGFHEHHGRPQ